MSATTKTTAGPGPAAKTFNDAMTGLKDGMANATHAAEPQVGSTAMATAKGMFQFHRDNLAAIMQSGQILAEGFAEMAKHLAANARTTTDEGMLAAQAALGTTSIKDAMELQTGFVRASYERAASDASRVAEQSMRLGEQAAAPLNARMTAAGSAFLPQR